MANTKRFRFPKLDIIQCFECGGLFHPNEITRVEADITLCKSCLDAMRAKKPEEKAKVGVE